MSVSPLHEKILGVLYGCAAGDALGYEIEFISWDSVMERYGEDGIRNYALSNGKASVSDDTQMTLFTAAGMALSAEHQTDPAEGIYRAYQDWYQTQDGQPENGWDKEDWLLVDRTMYQRQAPGNTCIGAMYGHEMGTLEHPLNKSKGCGGIMRTSVCGFVNPAQMSGFPQEHAAAILGAQAAAITHGHEMGWIPAAIFSDMIYRIAYHSMPIPDAARSSLDLLKQLFPKADGLAHLDEMITNAISWGTEDSQPGEPWDEETIEEIGGGWIGDEAIAVAIYCACKYQNDFSGCIRAAVNHSGDSDSTGAIAGAIVGASLGVNGIDPAWRETLDVRNAIEQTAERLLKVARPL